MYFFYISIKIKGRKKRSYKKRRGLKGELRPPLIYRRMAEPFSTTDVYYVNADQCDTAGNVSSGCFQQKVGDTANCECKYKENVDKLNAITSSSGLTKSQYGDLNKEHTLLLFNNISLGVGIVGMMWMMYSNSA